MPAVTGTPESEFVFVILHGYGSLLYTQVLHIIHT